MYKIIIIGGPAEKYIERCLNSIVNQNMTDWEACVVLDPVGDQTFEKAKRFASPKIKVIQNESQLYALPNILKCVEELKPSDDDVLVTVDADDWLEGANALTILDGYYKREPNLLVTHGSWQSYPNKNEITNNNAYSELDFNKGIRKVGFRASHLRTFKYKLWKRINVEDMKGPDGDFYKSAWDLAFMWPLVEMAGVHRTRYIPEVLYNYNQETPFNDAKVRLEEQCRLTDHQAIRPPYPYAGDI
jgi:glycosyltransferase involved in cell wall biosynthesis